MYLNQRLPNRLSIQRDRDPEATRAAHVRENILAQHHPGRLARIARDSPAPKTKTSLEML